MTFDFGQLVRARGEVASLWALAAIVGSGTVSNLLDGGPGKPVDDGGVGYSCIAEQSHDRDHPGRQARRRRSCSFGDRIRIEMCNAAGESIFGAIDQTVVRYTG